MHQVFKKIVISFILIIGLVGCMKNQEDETGGTIEKKKIKSANIDEKTREAAGGGFILGGAKKTIYEFNSANRIWRASLIILEDIPISNANYAGGIISTDWYNSQKSTESIKIQITFSDNKVMASSFKVKGFKKKCENNDCVISKTSQSFNDKIKNSILNKTRELSIKEEEKKK